MRGTVLIEFENCKGCSLCIPVCKQNCLALSKDINTQGYHYVELVNDECTGCVNCALVCPDAVFTVYRLRKEAKPAPAHGG